MNRLLVLTTAVLTFSLAPPAIAGQYTVKACFTDGRLGPTGNGSWYVASAFSPYVTTYASCPGEGIVTRMSGGSDSAPPGATARQTFAAPSGTSIRNIKAKIKINAARGWHAGFADTTPKWIWCGNNCSTLGQYLDFSIDTNTPQVFTQVSCGDASGCPRSSQYGILAMQDVSVTIDDPTPPGIALGGSLLTPGWHRGDQQLTVSSWDPAGLKGVDLAIDGRDAGGLNGPCDYARPRPCGDVSRSVTIPTHSFGPDGRRILSASATDASGDVTRTTREVLIDNSAPGQPLDPRLDGGEGWRATNSFTIGWRNPIEGAAPLNGARYSLCPASNVDGNGNGCAEGAASGRDLSSITGVRVPRPGEWRARVWLVDEAGNADRQRAVAVGALRFDDDVPALRMAPFDDRDPTRVRVAATDATSGIASAQIEAKRDGEDTWRSLPTRLEDGGFSAVLDDETLPRGRYTVRARAVDRAGNERSTDTLGGGEPATRTLPLRIATRLAVGAPKRIRARNSNGKVRYRTVLRVNPLTRFGRTIPLRGRLTMPGGNPLANADVVVWEKPKVPGAGWRRVSVIRTTSSGRFRFKALRGPSRTLRFHYPGTATIRSGTTQVDLGVRATTSFRASRDRVVNGEEVRFHGRLKGAQTGDLGKLLYLQVFTRGRWSTFATPRAHRATGRWSHAYRFSATRGLVRYRFRALIPREASFPYETGHSRSVRVTVRGL